MRYAVFMLILRWFAWGGMIRNICALFECNMLNREIGEESRMHARHCKKSLDLYPAGGGGLSVFIHMTVRFLLITIEITMGT